MKEHKDKGLGLYHFINECDLIIVNKETIQEAINRLLEHKYKYVEPTYYVSKELYDLIDVEIKNQYKN